MTDDEITAQILPQLKTHAEDIQFWCEDNNMTVPEMLERALQEILAR